MEKVVIALSGGVDSSVAAALLVRDGYEVVGATMRLWSAPGCEAENRCCTPDTRELARNLANQLNIPFHIIDASAEFRSLVVQPFLDGYSRGDTPNPCIFCNRFLKWGYLLEFARSIGANLIATGHYARIFQNPSGKLELWRGVDASKDQSYFLSLLTQEHLEVTKFPLGNYHKHAVRKMAQELNLRSADQPESQDLCFLGDRDYRDFLLEYVPEVANPGPIVNRAGKVLGEHQGLAFYTIGQRKGLPSSTQPLYVCEKDMQNNTLIVGNLEDLGQNAMHVTGVNWIAGAPPAQEFLADVKIRYKAIPAPARVVVGDDGVVQVTFTTSLRDITPGQMAVFYQGDLVLGGGIIS
jgi:tRNA-specific 2-thiouridylase